MKHNGISRFVGLTGLQVLLWISFVYPQPKSFTILHTNDIHASFVPHEAFWMRTDPKPMVGGFEELSWMVDSVRKSKQICLLLDGGDVMTGNPISDVEYKGVQGGSLFEMMNIMGYDAWTIGNHDLDISQDNLRKLTSLAVFPTLSANLVDTTGSFSLHNKPYIILSKNGIRFGIIGVMSKDLFLLTNRNNLKGLKVLPPGEATQKYIDEIGSAADVTIALTHEGADEDSVLAVATHGLNIIIGGHSHTRLEKPKVVNGVVICQTGSNCENLGVLDATVENHAVTKYDGQLLRLWLRHEKRDNQLTKLSEEIKAKIDKEYNEVLGTLTKDWRRNSSGESSIGDFVADAMREEVNADVAITNSTGIRRDLSAGPIRKIDLFEISPFRNYLCTFSIAGKELRRIITDHVVALARGRSALQISGVQCSWKRQSDAPALQNITVGGKDLDDGKQYTISTSDYLLTQSDKYLGMTPATFESTSKLMYEALVEKVKKEKTITPGNAVRFEEIK